MDLIDTIASMKPQVLSVVCVLLSGACQSSVEEDTSDTYEDYPTEVLSESGAFLVSWTSSPDPIVPVELFSVELEVQEADTEMPAGDAVELGLDVSMPGHGHGMTVEPVLEKVGEGRWKASPMKFHMTGYWEMVVSIQQIEGEDQAVFGVACCEAPQ